MTADSTVNSEAVTAQNGTSNSQPRAKICVYCGSSAGASPAHMEAARALGKAMAANNIDLVYGGGTIGLMGEVAKTLASINGPESVHGIIPEALIKRERDDTYKSLTKKQQVVPDETVYGRTTVVKDMHTRKKLMAEEVFAGGPGSGFIGLSGGFGTMEEIFETTTWNQLGIHNSGIVLLNVEGYWDSIVQWMTRAREQGFIKPLDDGILVTADTAEAAIAALRDYKKPDAVHQVAWGNQ
ncbi:lysine decarboxylase [Fusarium albosuccineum]|uniref:Lysine decarboxylase n=1 Tax=Fusarium albosuccineum TaxID=1237068 RepID=A0A8H4L6F5_9HYPO|nr:lysine decarboxylase [Fusarium albosuccineum]KAF5001539.1 hypothetical protein FDECE_10918 [Fusarium decemcellulare]